MSRVTRTVIVVTIHIVVVSIDIVTATNHSGLLTNVMLRQHSHFLCVDFIYIEISEWLVCSWKLFSATSSF